MEVSNNIFEILKEELRKKELTIEVFCSNVLKISRLIFDRLKKCFLWSQAITADDDQKISYWSALSKIPLGRYGLHLLLLKSSIDQPHVSVRSSDPFWLFSPVAEAYFLWHKALSVSSSKKAIIHSYPIWDRHRTEPDRTTIHFSSSGRGDSNRQQ